MVRARLARVALAAALGLAFGCSSTSNCSLTSRLTSLFRRDAASHEVIGAPIDGPVIGDPGVCDLAPPPPVPPPRPVPWNEAQRMPYQP